MKKLYEEGYLERETGKYPQVQRQKGDGETLEEPESTQV